MNDLTTLLEEYDQLIQNYRAIMERELLSLKDSGALDENLTEPKQVLLNELGAKLQVLKSFQSSAQGFDPDLKSRLDQVQQKFLQVIKLDREVEKEYLGQQSTSRSELRSIAGGSRDLASARRIYGQ